MVSGNTLNYQSSWALLGIHPIISREQTNMCYNKGEVNYLHSRPGTVFVDMLECSSLRTTSTRVTWLPRDMCHLLHVHLPGHVTSDIHRVRPPRWLAESFVTSRVTWPRAWSDELCSSTARSVSTALLTLSLFCTVFVDLCNMADSSTEPAYTLGGAESTTSDDFIRSTTVSSSQSPQKPPPEDISHVKRPMNAFMVRFVKLLLYF